MNDIGWGAGSEFSGRRTGSDAGYGHRSRLVPTAEPAGKDNYAVGPGVLVRRTALRRIGKRATMGLARVGGNAMAQWHNPSGDIFLAFAPPTRSPCRRSVPASGRSVDPWPWKPKAM
ncbi:hypothetical protein C8R43DRAFT_1141340 [Mycena crocata]|nr:hypothetical protein C8R43DRAFT_1141340 [Mycena crocata]